MTSAPMRDQLADHLITRQNVALLLIPNQPAQLAAVHSRDHALLFSTSRSTTAAASSPERPGHRLTPGFTTVLPALQLASPEGLRQVLRRAGERSSPDSGDPPVRPAYGSQIAGSAGPTPPG